MEIYNADDKVDPCYGLEEEIVNEEMIKALLLGKKLYTTINCGEYAITIKYERGADNMFTNARELGELKDTIEDMISDDYIRRYKAEYRQLVIRIDKLTKYVKHYINSDSFIEQQLKAQQLEAMIHYRNILEMRANINNIKLNEGDNLD